MRVFFVIIRNDSNSITSVCLSGHLVSTKRKCFIYCSVFLAENQLDTVDS